jgi:hypothetical protein
MSNSLLDISSLQLRWRNQVRLCPIVDVELSIIPTEAGLWLGIISDPIQKSLSLVESRSKCLIFQSGDEKLTVRKGGPDDTSVASGELRSVSDETLLASFVCDSAKPRLDGKIIPKYSPIDDSSSEEDVSSDQPDVMGTLTVKLEGKLTQQFRTTRKITSGMVLRHYRKRGDEWQILLDDGTPVIGSLSRYFGNRSSLTITLQEC